MADAPAGAGLQAAAPPSFTSKAASAASAAAAAELEKSCAACSIVVPAPLTAAAAAATATFCLSMASRRKSPAHAPTCAADLLPPTQPPPRRPPSSPPPPPPPAASAPRRAPTAHVSGKEQAPNTREMVLFAGRVLANRDRNKSRAVKPQYNSTVRCSSKGKAPFVNSEANFRHSSAIAPRGRRCFRAACASSPATSCACMLSTRPLIVGTSTEWTSSRRRASKWEQPGWKLSAAPAPRDVPAASSTQLTTAPSRTATHPGQTSQLPALAQLWLRWMSTVASPVMVLARPGGTVTGKRGSVT